MFHYKWFKWYVCLCLSEKQLETLANSLAGGQKAKRPNEFKCNDKNLTVNLQMVEMVCLSLSFEKQSETVANSLTGGQKAKRPNEFKCNNKLELYVNSIYV